MTPNSLVFLRRFGSTVVLWTVALWIILSGYELGFDFLIGSLAMVGLWEYYTMLDHKKLPNFKIIGLICGGIFLIGSFYYFSQIGPLHSYDFEVATLLFFLLVVFARQMFQRTRDISPLDTMAYTLFGLFYVTWMFTFVTKIVYILPRDAAGHVTGHFYVLFLILVTKFSDMGAYVTGSLVGKHLMVPHISPKKTWEGFVGALAFSTGGACAMVAWMPKHTLSYFHQRDAIFLGLGLGLAAIIGDLGESIIKRSCDVKDSGHLLPGIGGALDLIDSILFTAPLLFFYLRFVLNVS
ncbi:phosphatidate cytidylyltransferase [Chthoniobacter flavus Ellin428]|uniref:Phosphatidate cytidylyltransferase n=1 Tax=Chthoniobacter flavus Ellin428 TaxID=497964 RepID=B4D7P6_9BACT|nr:phosphatidate cytidylyltransferase [Chthoniobacter flavus]EDY17536.1 phosphatidate cytidylyltransferase [Chthoniobacter flavus Ellin428]TCO92430.1 phosphatidate cytidylyltransferase [Chthoniobacter flavus]